MSILDKYNLDEEDYTYTAEEESLLPSIGTKKTEYSPVVRGTISSTGSLLGRALISTGETFENSLEAIGLNDPKVDTVSALRNIDYFKPDIDEKLNRGFLQKTKLGSVPSAFESAGPSLAVAGAGFAIGSALGGGINPLTGTIGAVVASLGIMGTSAYQQTLESELARGTAPDLAKIKALEVGAIEGGGEGLSSAIGLGPLGKIFGKSAIQTARQILKTPVKDIAKGVALTYGKEQLTEFGQSIGETLVLNQGVLPEEKLSVVEQALSTVIPTAFMTMGFSAGTTIYNEKQKSNILSALENKEDKKQRTLAASIVYKGIEQEDPEVATAWKTYADDIIATDSSFDLDKSFIEAAKEIEQEEVQRKDDIVFLDKILKDQVSTEEASTILDKALEVKTPAGVAYADVLITKEDAEAEIEMLPEIEKAKEYVKKKNVTNPLNFQLDAIKQLEGIVKKLDINKVAADSDLFPPKVLSTLESLKSKRLSVEDTKGLLAQGLEEARQISPGFPVSVAKNAPEILEGLDHIEESISLSKTDEQKQGEAFKIYPATLVNDYTEEVQSFIEDTLQYKVDPNDKSITVTPDKFQQVLDNISRARSSLSAENIESALQHAEVSEEMTPVPEVVEPTTAPEIAEPTTAPEVVEPITVSSEEKEIRGAPEPIVKEKKKTLKDRTKDNKIARLERKGQEGVLTQEELEELGNLKFGKESTEIEKERLRKEEAVFEEARQSALEEAEVTKAEELDISNIEGTKGVKESTFITSGIEEEELTQEDLEATEETLSPVKREKRKREIESTPTKGGIIRWVLDPESFTSKNKAAIISGATKDTDTQFTILAQGKGRYTILADNKRVAVDLGLNEAKQRAEDYLKAEERVKWDEDGSVTGQTYKATWGDWTIYSAGKRLNIAKNDIDVKEGVDSKKQAKDFVASQEKGAPSQTTRSPKEAAETTRSLKDFTEEDIETLSSTSVLFKDGKIDKKESRKLLESYLRSSKFRFITEESKKDVLSSFDNRFLKSPEQLDKDYLKENVGTEKNAKELLQTLSKSSNPVIKMIAKLVLANGDVSVLEKTLVYYDPFSLSGYYDITEDQIILNNNGETQQIHEVLHSLTARQMNTNPQLAVEFNKLFEAYKNKLNDVPLDIQKKAGVQYSLINLDEFISQGIANPDVREILKGIKIEESGKSFIRNAFDSFTDLIRKALGLQPFQYNALTKLMDLVVESSQISPEEKLAGRLFSMAKNQKSPEEFRESLLEELRKHHVPITPGEKLKSNLQDFYRDSKKIVHNTFRISSESLRAISPKYTTLMKRYEFNVDTGIKEDLTEISSFVEKVKKLNLDDMALLRYNLYNSSTQFKYAEEVMKKNNIYEDYVKVKKTLDRLEKRAEDIGVLPTKIPDYFPRVVKDYEGYIKWMSDRAKTDDSLALDIKAAEEAMIKKGVTFTEEEKLKLIVDYISTGSYARIPNPRSVKLRTVKTVHKEAMQFYNSIEDSLINHIYDMHNKVAAWEIIGKKNLKQRISLINQIRDLQKDLLKTPDDQEKSQQLSQALDRLQDPDLALTESLAIMLKEDKGLLEYDRQSISRIFKARFNQKGVSGAIQSLKNVGLLMTLGNPLSAITQLNDQVLNIYANGGRAALGGMIEALTDNKISDKFNFDHALREFSNKTSSRWLERALSITGFKKMDIFGKEAFLKAARNRYASMSLSEFKKIWGNDGEFLTNVEKTHDDIKSNLLEGDSLFVLYSDLSDFQPISLSETPLYYQTSGNLRIMWMLKTYSIKTMNTLVRELSGLWRADNAADRSKAVMKFSYLLALLGFAGAGTDEIKDLILGRKKQFSDHVLDNLVQLTLMSRYNFEKGLQRGNLLQSIAGGMLPPVGYLDDAIQDTVSFFSEDKTFKSLRNVPIGGRFMYDRLTEGGRKAEYSRRRLGILNRVADGENLSDLSGDLAEFNRYARRYGLIPITRETLRKARKRGRDKNK